MNDLTNNHKTAFVISSMLWAICVLCFINEIILAKAKTLLLLANTNTFLLVVLTSYQLL